VILFTEGSTDAQASEAEKVMHLLCTAYPGHPWAVRVDEGIIFIRHLAYGKNWGMNLKTREADHDAAVLKRKIVMLAGEWLERAGLARTRYDDAEITKVEGVPEPNAQPFRPAEIVVEHAEMRDRPRPQVMKNG
jgi:hypothetical protein